MFSYKGTVIIKYSMKALTGLRVGGSKENFDIGGTDNPVIKTLGDRKLRRQRKQPTGGSTLHTRLFSKGQDKVLGGVG